MQAAETHRSATDGWTSCALGVLLAGLGILAAVHPSLATLTIAIGVSLAIAAAAAWNDLREGTVPDTLVFGSSLPSLGAILGEAVDGHGAEAFGATTLGVLALAGPLLIAHLVAPRAMGFGDVKLAAALGAALGLVDWRAGMLALVVASGATAGVGVVRRAAELPFGPGLVVGSTLALIVVATSGRTGAPWH